MMEIVSVTLWIIGATYLLTKSPDLPSGCMSSSTPPAGVRGVPLSEFPIWNPT